MQPTSAPISVANIVFEIPATFADEENDPVDENVEEKDGGDSVGQSRGLRNGGSTGVAIDMKSYSIKPVEELERALADLVGVSE